MCGGVDLNHTALTDLQQRLTAVEGSVGSLENSTYGYVPDSWRAVKNENITSSSFIDIVNITGKGRLHLVTAKTFTGSAGLEWKVTIDGASTTVAETAQNTPSYIRSFLFDIQYVVGISGSSGSNIYNLALMNIHNESLNSMGNPFTPGYVEMYSAYAKRDMRFVTKNLGADCASPTWFVTKGGVPFEKNLRVQCRSVDGGTVSCYACYSLN